MNSGYTCKRMRATLCLQCLKISINLWWSKRLCLSIFGHILPPKHKVHLLLSSFFLSPQGNTVCLTALPSSPLHTDTYRAQGQHSSSHDTMEGLFQLTESQTCFVRLYCIDSLQASSRPNGSFICRLESPVRVVFTPSRVSHHPRFTFKG